MDNNQSCHHWSVRDCYFYDQVQNFIHKSWFSADPGLCRYMRCGCSTRVDSLCTLKLLYYFLLLEYLMSISPSAHGSCKTQFPRYEDKQVQLSLFYVSYYPRLFWPKTTNDMTLCWPNNAASKNRTEVLPSSTRTTRKISINKT